MNSPSPCEPTYATPRTPGRKTYGGRAAVVANSLGTPFMPWQQMVADVALEVDPATGLLAYREVIVTVPRQSGKTTEVLSVSTLRCLAFRNPPPEAVLAPGLHRPLPQRVVYTAQTRGDARKKWEDDHLPILKQSPWGPPGEANRPGRFYSVRKTTGNEAVLWNNGSQYGIMSTTIKAGHGPTVDMGVIDEAFAQEDARLEQAFKPSMITRPQPQLWILSTAGTEASTYLRSKVDAGRIMVGAGINSGTCYFEWSAPLDADPADPATWRACMPALGITVTEEAIQADYTSMTASGKLADFRRAYLNQWLDLIPDEWLVIPEESWRGLTAEPVAYGEVAFGVDVTPQRSFSSIMAAWRRPDGHMDVEVVAHSPGTQWLPRKLASLVKKHRVVRDAKGNPVVVMDPASPGGSVIDNIENDGVPITRINTREYAQASQRFFDMVMDSRTLRHNDDPVLTRAVAGAIRRDLADGGWAWARKATSVDISPLCGATFAIWGHDKFARRTPPYDLMKSVG